MSTRRYATIGLMTLLLALPLTTHANERLLSSAQLAAQGTIGEVLPNQCLRLIRQVVEHAFDLPSHTFYSLYWTHRVEENDTLVPWARDLERSLRAQGYAVYTVQPGDLVFDYRIAWPYGHVGLVLPDYTVLDVATWGSTATLRTVPLSQWGEPTTIIRLPDLGQTIRADE